MSTHPGQPDDQLPSARIRVAADGPYVVSNVKRLTDWLGQPLPVEPEMRLCRCGQSAKKPFCDCTSLPEGFRAAKDPGRVPDRRDTYVGQQITIFDNRGICQHSGFCTDRLATVFRVDREPFVAPSGGRMDEIVRAVRACPSGALSYAIDGVEARAQVDHHDTRSAAIEVTRDGPYRITGGIPLVDDDGVEVPRNAGSSSEHYALCRCGHSRNKPFCSGMHWYVDFRDPLPAQAPTVFEWAGGLPALTRMTRIFYEKYVPQDPLLAPVFDGMDPEHPERVAMWLGEVFGGPKRYTEKRGGYDTMLAQHRGRRLTEAQRARWVELLTLSSREAGLPDDPEFRSTFQSYIEWGSRLAVENSQAESRPPQHMPMPHWEWNTAAGPPGSRMSALRPAAEDASSSSPPPPPPLPAPDEPVSFERHLRPWFRERDRQSMRFVFDLWSHEDVKSHAAAILERLQAGTMPCDGRWPEDRVAVMARWVKEGCAP